MGNKLLFATLFSCIGSGCNLAFPLPTIELGGRSPVAVEPDVDRILTDWQKHRSTSKSIFAKFKQTVKGERRRNQYEFVTVLKTVNSRHEKGQVVRTGSIRILPNLGRIDFNKDENGKGREIVLWTPKNEYWHLWASEHRIEIFEFPREAIAKSPIFEYLKATPFAWLSPADKTMLQKHGAIRKVSENAQGIVLRVENVKREYDREEGYESLTVHLRKSDLLPTKLIITESKDCEVTWEFTEVHENLEFGESDFIPPKLDLSQWKITRQKLPSEKQSKAPKDDAKK